MRDESLKKYFLFAALMKKVFLKLSALLAVCALHTLILYTQTICVYDLSHATVSVSAVCRQS